MNESKTIRTGVIPRLEGRISIPSPLPSKSELEEKIEAIRAWALTANFGACRTDSTDHRVLDAILALMLTCDSEKVITSSRSIGRSAGVDNKTAIHSIERLNGWAFDVRESNSRFGKYEISLLTHAKFLGNYTEENRVYSTGVYSTHRNSSAFLNGTSKYVRSQASSEAIEWEGETTQDWIKKYKLSSLKELGLRIVTILDNAPEGLTIEEVASYVQRSKRTIEEKVYQLVEFGLVKKNGKKGRRTIYSLLPNWLEIIEAQEDTLATYRKEEEIEVSRLESSILKNVESLAQTRIKEGNTKNLKRKIDDMLQSWSRLQCELERFDSQWEAYQAGRETLLLLPLQNHANRMLEEMNRDSGAAIDLLDELEEGKY